MLLALSFAAIAAMPPQVQVRVETRSDSAAAPADSTRRRRRPIIEVTPQHLATAFDDDRARRLLERARVARLQQDSSLVSYDATTMMRFSIGLGLSKWARDRLAARAEQAARVRWHRDHGVWVDVKGRRAVAPVVQGLEEAEDDMQNDMDDDEDFSVMVIPYFPGQEPIFIAGGGLARADIREDEIIHPLARGAEAYYRYRSGDSLDIRLPDGRHYTVRELRVRPREPRWSLLVGSFWFDVERGTLVRAAYRFSEPFELWTHLKEEEPHEIEEIPRILRPMMSSIRFDLTSVTLEYGLHEGRFWLPRFQVAEGQATAVGFRAPISVMTTVRYASVNGLDSLPRFAVRARGDTARTADDSLRDSLYAAIRDSLAGRVASGERGVTISIGPPDNTPDSARLDRRARAISARRLREIQRSRVQQCDTSLVEIRTSRRFDGSLPVAVAMPCDRSKLATSPDLPPSIFAADEEVFDAASREELMQALDYDAQAEWEPQPMRLSWGLGRGLLRYNRIEGLAVGLGADQRLGAGYTAHGLARLATADVKASGGELSLVRSNGRNQIGIGIYRRLAVANDLEQPFGFGSSFGALFFGRDDGLYYHSTGVEFTGVGEQHPRTEWRLFVERQQTAEPGTDFSIASWVGSTEFAPNIVAAEGDYAGLALRTVASFGRNPVGWRLLADARFESAANMSDPDFAYTRLSGDATVSRTFGRVAGSLTGSSGIVIGGVPIQRQFHLGGPRTVRGEDPGAQSGTMYWLGRAEAGTAVTFARPVVFFDVGWAGNRFDWKHPGATMAGTGIGASFLDGMLRVDLSRGLRPERQWRFDLYVESRF